MGSSRYRKIAATGGAFFSVSVHYPGLVVVLSLQTAMSHGHDVTT